MYIHHSTTLSFLWQTARQIISWSSAGKMGFRGSKKNTPYAAQMAAQDCAKVAYDLGLRKVKAYVKVLETDVSLLSELYTELELKLLKLST